MVAVLSQKVLRSMNVHKKIRIRRAIFRMSLFILSLTSANRSHAHLTDVLQSVGRNRSQGRIRDVKWEQDGKSLSYSTGSRRINLDLVSFDRTESGIDRTQREVKRVIGGGLPSRDLPDPGRVLSPSGRFLAKLEDHNVFIENLMTGDRMTVTTDGTSKIPYGRANYAHGSDSSLRLLDGMWWTPDERHLLFLKCDGTGVQKTHIVHGMSTL